MQFTYRAKQDVKTEASGVIEATDLSAAIAHLKGMGLYPLEVVPLQIGEKGSGTFSRAGLLAKARSLSRRDLSLWARMIGQGLKAGLSLTQSLALLAEQEKARPIGQIAKALQDKVTGGMSLAEAMGQGGGAFPPVAVALVKAGEASGALEQVLEAFAIQVEAESDLIAKVRGALAYPLFVLTVSIGTIAVLILFVMPKLTQLFAETGQAIPWMTRWLMASGRGFLFSLIGMVMSALVLWLGTRQGWWKFPLATWGMRFLGRLPVFGKLIVQAEVARLSDTLSLLLGQGLPLPESLRLVATTVGSPELKIQLNRSQPLVVEGVSLSTSLRQVNLKEPFLLTMISLGEAQGDLALAFHQAGVRYREEVDRSIRLLSSLVEPAMILLVGLIVGGLVFSMLLPIFQINFTVG